MIRKAKSIIIFFEYPRFLSYLAGDSVADKICFIGAGNMAGAIIEGILSKKVCEASDIGVIDISREKCKKFAKRGINVYDTYEAAAKNSDIIFLSVKPQNYDEVLDALRGYTDGKIIVSIAAGISTKFIKSKLGKDSLVVRAMPNTPLLLGCGATALCHVAPVTDQQFDKVKRIFEAGGSVDILPEDKMNAVISVNSSSPAYVYLFAKAVIDGAVKQGIDYDTAKGLIAKTLEGSAKMIMSSGYSPDELIKMVSSPGGTTLKALEALYEHDFEGAIIDAMQRCTKRAEELGK